ncbi:MAG: hypothetical protein KDA75_21705, partial [Planctomycetaceae bacterium]|nr:hypothetical protein [Planctomycetaceae bacterium]
TLGTGAPLPAPASSKPMPTGAAGAGAGRPSASLREKLQGTAAPAAGGSAPRSVESRTAAQRPGEDGDVEPGSPQPGLSSPSIHQPAVVSVAANDQVVALSDPSEATQTSTANHFIEVPTAAIAVADEPTRPDLASECIDAYWSQLLQRVPDTLAAHLKNAQNIATSGPNEVEIRFPLSYLFSMNYCQRDEPLKMLVKLASELAGKPVHIRLKADGSVPAGRSSQPAKPRMGDANRLRPKVVEDDPFVQQAVSIFGGTVVDVRKVLADVAETVAEGRLDEDQELEFEEPDD